MALHHLAPCEVVTTASVNTLKISMFVQFASIHCIRTYNKHLSSPTIVASLVNSATQTPVTMAIGNMIYMLVFYTFLHPEGMLDQGHIMSVRTYNYKPQQVFTQPTP